MYLEMKKSIISNCDRTRGTHILVDPNLVEVQRNQSLNFFVEPEKVSGVLKLQDNRVHVTFFFWSFILQNFRRGYLIYSILFT